MKSKDYQKGHHDGFIRCAMLILGTKIKWTQRDRLLRAKATRMLFGKKRK